MSEVVINGRDDKHKIDKIKMEKKVAEKIKPTERQAEKTTDRVVEKLVKAIVDVTKRDDEKQHNTQVNVSTVPSEISISDTKKG